MALGGGIGEALPALAVAAGDAEPGRGVLVALLLVGLIAIAAGLRLLLGHWSGGNDSTPDADPSDTPGPVHPVVADAHQVEIPRCDWSLVLDVGTGEPVTVRRPVGPACCVHTVRLASTVPLGRSPVVQEHLAWSGDQTRVTGNLVASQTHQDLVTSQRTPEGLGLATTVGLVRGPGPLVTTPWTSLPAPRASAMDHERMWAAHLDALRERGARTRGDQDLAIHIVEITDRCEVSIDVSRGCDDGHHVLDATARARVRVGAASHGATEAGVTIDGGVAWMSGDMGLVATTPLSTDGLVDVVAAAGEVPRVSLDPVDDPASVVLVDQSTTTISDGGLDIATGSDMVAKLVLGPPTEQTAEVRVEVRAELGLAVRVVPVARHARSDLGCACTPTYKFWFGELPPGNSAPSPAAYLDVDDRRYLVGRMRGTDLDGTPIWTVRDGGRPDDRGVEDDTAGQTGGRPVPGRDGTGGGHVGVRDADTADPRPAGSA